MGTNPGKDQVGQIRHGLLPLPRRLRTAFALACAERVLPIINRYSSPRMAKMAMDLGWRFALGEDLGDAQVRQLLERYDEIVNEHYDLAETDFVLAASFAPYHALHSALGIPDYDGAEYASGSASGAAAIGDREHGDVHVVEELDWQLEALATVATWHGDAQRDMFAPIASTPNWLEELRRKLAHP